MKCYPHIEEEQLANLKAIMGSRFDEYHENVMVILKSAIQHDTCFGLELMTQFPELCTQKNYSVWEVWGVDCTRIAKPTDTYRKSWVSGIWYGPSLTLMAIQPSPNDQRWQVVASDQDDWIEHSETLFETQSEAMDLIDRIAFEAHTLRRVKSMLN